VEINTLLIKPLNTSHDATNPCGYLIKDNDETLVYITDTGYIKEDTLSICKNPTYLILESNHDISMLIKSNRPARLKSRIMSDVGHLCNEDSAIFATYIIGSKTKEIVLAHLSEECNTEDKALKAYNKVFKKMKVSLNQIRIRCAKQYSTLLGGDYEI
jgi:phosphoribosyl 1,2-cyclic phosphodiesterase